jgi:outer membrane protein TolC
MNRSLILLLLLCAWIHPFPCSAESEKLTLLAFIKIALPYADTIKLAEVSLYAAEQDRLRARSVLVPSVELTGRLSGHHTDLQGASAPPNHIKERSYGSFVGLGFEYTFYLNGRELIVYKASGELVQKAGM